MNKYTLLFLLLISTNSVAYDVIAHYQNLEEEYEKAMASGEYKLAIDKSLELNGIDPSDTYALLCIVFAHAKAEKKIPEWVLKNPWPDATSQDKINRQLAEVLANGT